MECNGRILAGEKPCKNTSEDGICDYHKELLKIAVHEGFIRTFNIEVPNSYISDLLKSIKNKYGVKDN